MSESNEFEDVPGLVRPPDPEPVGAEDREGEEHGEHHHPHHFRMLRVQGDELVEVRPDEIKTYDDETDVPRREESEGPHGNEERA
jgi:hypothetical protein